MNRNCERLLYREKLTKSFFMSLPEGVYLASNCGSPSYYEGYVSTQSDREKQWKDIVSARASQRLCNVFKTQEDWNSWVRKALENSADRL